ncbi:hypothetical protein N656DRAFT_848067 [Canariomyces notabilis]|uniref:Uncharacterized protein n=1 Tax=Canariomyces notabilis TaxID=2074819 RepID=A0AAN6QFB0_9PEZI|nr:hypothetical protein N656DRAFT_848067 [Canariomyces arenarius]
MCDNHGAALFCSPQEGSQLQTGESVEITWDPSFFDTTPFQVLIQADFFDGSSSTTTGEKTGFTSAPLNTNTGRFTWSILESYLPPGTNATSAALSIAEPIMIIPASNRTTNSHAAPTPLAGRMRYPGPTVSILRASTGTDIDTNTTTFTATSNNTSSAPNQQTQTQQPQSSTSQSPTRQQQQQPGTANTLAIALPVAFGLLTLLLMAGYVLLKRHNPGFSARTFFSGAAATLQRWWVGTVVAGVKGGGGGYGERQSRGQRVGTGQGKSLRKKMTGNGNGNRNGVTGGLRGKEIRVVTTDLDGLRMNAVRMGMAEGSNWGRGYGPGPGNAGVDARGAGWPGMMGVGLGSGTISSRAEGSYGDRERAPGNVFRDELWRQERERV